VFHASFYNEIYIPVNIGSQGNIASIVTIYMLAGLGFESRKGKEIFFSKPSRLALWPTQHPIKWVPGFFPESKVAGARI
jgi:hypothetical protein